MFSDQSLFVLGVLALNIVASIWLEKKTFLKSIGAALLVIIITAITANLRIIPSATDSSPVYDAVFTYIAPISIFYLLLGVNLQKLKEAGGPMLILFGVGALGTCLGVFIADFFLGEVFEGFRSIVAGMITGTYVGGSLNFNAISLHYDFVKEGNLYAAIVAVDNILTTVWMAVTLVLPPLMSKLLPREKKERRKLDEANEFDDSRLSMWSLAILMLMGISTLLFSNWVQDQTSLPSILILTTIALIFAQFPRFQKMGESKIIGLYLIYLFLAVVGAHCELEALWSMGVTAFKILGYLSIVLVVHGIIVIVFGLIAKMEWDYVAVASQANIGGSSSALALSKSINRDDLLLPAVLIGSLGNAVGTYFGFAIISVI